MVSANSLWSHFANWTSRSVKIASIPFSKLSSDVSVAFEFVYDGLVYGKNSRMEIINGPVLPRYAAPATGALTSDAKISGQLLRRVHLRRRACGLQGDHYRAARRFFGFPSERHARSGWVWPVCCSYGSSSDGDGAAAADYDASGEEFVNSSVMEAGNCLLLLHCNL